MNKELVNEFLTSTTKLVAVSKTRTIEDIQSMYDLGQRDFGENRVQELQSKVDKLPEDIIWHCIGHLQKNKVKYIAEYVDWIHSVDSFSLLKKIDKEAKKHDRIINVLFQFKIATEETKFGFDHEKFNEYAHEFDFNELENINYCGVMGMASFVNDHAQVKAEFLKLKAIFLDLKENQFATYNCFTDISMGMSGDYKIAIECGSTMVRIGTLLFK